MASRRNCTAWVNSCIGRMPRRGSIFSRLCSGIPVQKVRGKSLFSLVMNHSGRGTTGSRKHITVSIFLFRKGNMPHQCFCTGSFLSIVSGCTATLYAVRMTTTYPRRIPSRNVLLFYGKGKACIKSARRGKPMRYCRSTGQVISRSTI